MKELAPCGHVRLMCARQKNGSAQNFKISKFPCCLMVSYIDSWVVQRMRGRTQSGVFSTRGLLPFKQDSSSYIDYSVFMTQQHAIET